MEQKVGISQGCLGYSFLHPSPPPFYIVASFRAHDNTDYLSKEHTPDALPLAKAMLSASAGCVVVAFEERTRKRMRKTKRKRKRRTSRKRKKKKMEWKRKR